MTKKLNFHQLWIVTKQKWIPAFPTIFVSLVLFLSLFLLFGLQFVILCAFLTLLFQTRHLRDFRLKEQIKTALLMYLVCLCAFFTTRNLVFCIVFNLFVPFLLVVLLTDKFNPKAYFVYGMEFVFLQLVPISAKDLPKQIVALSFGLAVVILSLYLYSRIIKRRRHYGTARKGMKNLSIQLQKLLHGESVSSEMSSLTRMMYHMNQVIYSSRNYTYLATGYGKINYYFMLIFQRFYYFIDHFNREELLATKEDRDYFASLSQLFASVEKEMNQIDNFNLSTRLNHFLETNTLSYKKANEAMTEILSILIYTLSSMTQVSMYRHEKDWKLPLSFHPVRDTHFFTRLDRFQIRFALRLAVVLCISFTFCFATKLNHSYWYPMSAFLMLMPYAEDSVLKINNRIIGTIVGVCIVFVFTEFFTSLTSHLILIIIMTFFMYSAPVTSWTLTMYTTCYGLALTTLTLDREEAILLRIGYVVLAAVTTFLANYFLLPNTAESEFKKSINELFDIDIKLIKELQKWKVDKPDMNEFRTLIVHANLLSNEIQTYMDNNLSAEEQNFYHQLLPINHHLISEIEQLNSYLERRKGQFDFQNNVLAKQLFQNLEDATKRIRLSFTSNELTSSIIPDKNYRIYGSLDDNLYFNTVALNCMKSVNHLSDLCAKLPIKVE